MMRTLLVLFSLFVGVAPESSPVPEVAPPVVAEKRAEVEEQLRVAQQSLREAHEDETTSSSADARRVDLLKQLSLLYTQQETAAERSKELASAKATAEQTLQELLENGPTEKKPYSFFLQETLQDSLTAQKAKVKTAAATVEVAAQTLARAKETLEDKEKSRRQYKEKLAENTDAEAASQLDGDHDLAKLESKLAAAEADLRMAELANAKLEKEIADSELAFSTAKLEKVSREVRFSEKDLKRQLQDLAKLESDIARRTKENDAEVNLLRGEWEKARQRLDKAPASAVQLLQTEVQARWRMHNLRDSRTEYFTIQGTWVRKLLEVWSRRYQVATDQFESAELAVWKGETQSLLDLLAADKSIKQARRAELRATLEEIERRASDTGPADVNRWLSAEAEAIRGQIEFISDHIARGESVSRTAKRLLSEIKQRTAEFSIVEWIGLAWDNAVAVSEYELINDDDKPVRVKAVVFGLLLLALGYRFSRKLSKAIGTRVLPRCGINAGGAAALEMLSFYALLLGTTLMALNVVKVPLTMFTFLGGAAAIGVGFGSQNIVNNFISGLILLTEQPIRVGDLIEVDGLSGKVEAIGMRSTRLRSGSMQEIIVPNSSFLENNVVNWTRTNATIGCAIPVSVAYGSPTREVTRWLKRAADEHGLVLDKPEPLVTLAAFGESTLQFQLNYHIAVRSLGDRGRIESDLRFIIDQYFREAGISMAFPQRDLHLDTQRPLEVRMLPAEIQPHTEGRSETRAA